MAITKPVVGGSSGTWGTVLNTALDDLQSQLVTNLSAQNSLAGRVSTAETNITNIQAASGSAGFYSGNATARAANTQYAGGAHYYETDTQRHFVGSSTKWIPMPGSLVFKGRSGSSASLLDSTWTTIVWTTEYDRFGVGTTAGAYTPGVAGWYEFTGSNGFSIIGTTGTRSLCWYLNGAAMNSGTTTFGGTGAIVVPARSICYQLTTTDSITLRAYQNSGDTITMLGGNATQAGLMCVKYLGAA